MKLTAALKINHDGDDLADFPAVFVTLYLSGNTTDKYKYERMKIRVNCH